MKKFLIFSLTIYLFLGTLSGCTTSQNPSKEPLNPDHGTGQTTETTEEKNEQFQALMDRLFIETMEEDAMGLHYTLKNPAAYGINKPEQVIGHADLESYEEDRQITQERIQQLQDFDDGQLNKSEQLDRDVLVSYYQKLEALYAYPEFDWYFLPSSGVLMNLPTNFLEYVFYQPGDVEDYLSILQSVPTYLQEAMELTQIQAEQGYFMQDSTLDATLLTIDDFLSKQENHPLILEFNRKIDELEGLSKAQKEEAKSRNQDIVVNEIFPSYAKVQEQLETLRGTSRVAGGLANYEQGKDYYQALVRYKTGSDKTIEQWFAEAEEYLTEILFKLVFIMQKNPDSVEEYYALASGEIQADGFGLSPEETMAWLQENLTQDFPQGPQVQVEIAYLDETVADENIVAYYMQPPFDDISRNSIKMNRENILRDPMQFFTTLAHEGFPGHCYQFTYYTDLNPHPLRRNVSFLGYSEGWAKYIETVALSWTGISESAVEVGKIESAFGYVLQSIVDLGVNGLGWSQEDTFTYLDDYGYGDLADVLYEAVVQEPAQILPYGLGYMMHQKFRDETEATLAEQFNSVEYHEMILKQGMQSFELLEKAVAQFVEEHR